MALIQMFMPMLGTLLERVSRRSHHEISPVLRTSRELVIFIHINKTGGTSIGTAIGLPQKLHLTAREVIQMAGQPAWEAAYKFSIVRNPWNKVVSHYKHRIRTNQTGLGDNPIPFDEWVRATYGPDQREPYYDNPKMFQPQVEWLRDLDGNINLDFIGRFENLGAAFDEISTRLALSTTLPHLNRTEPTDYRSFYSTQSAEMVGAWFHEDVSLFDYQFDPRPGIR